jgi:hypothetical protein
MKKALVSIAMGCALAFPLVRTRQATWATWT